METYGGIGRHGLNKLRVGARIAKGCGKARGKDTSRYGRYHRSGYLGHHISRISAAAVTSNAAGMLQSARARALLPIRA